MRSPRKREVLRHALASTLALVLSAVFFVSGSLVASGAPCVTDSSSWRESSDVAVPPTLITQAISEEDSDAFDGNGRGPDACERSLFVGLDEDRDIHIVVHIGRNRALRGVPFRLTAFPGRAPPSV